MNQDGNLAFPYLFKDSGYKYEAEVRFVFGVHPNLLANAPGIVAEIDGKSLVQSYVSKLWISPDIPKEEGNIIRHLIAEIRKSNSINFSYPPEKDIQRLMRFKTVGGNPFTAADEPVGLLTDLNNENSLPQVSYPRRCYTWRHQTMEYLPAAPEPEDQRRAHDNKATSVLAKLLRDQSLSLPGHDKRS